MPTSWSSKHHGKVRECPASDAEWPPQVAAWRSGHYKSCPTKMDGRVMSKIHSPVNLAVIVFFGASITAALGQAPQLGYDDTPFQPNGEWRVHDSKRPLPRVVTPGPVVAAAPPSDATILLGQGGDLSPWQTGDGSPATWPLSEGVLQTGTGYIQTKATFTDIQLHVEFATPAKVEGESQDRGNSGVFLAGAFEIQVLDSFQNPTYADGQAAALYGQHPPLVNASRMPGEWQSYDVVFTAPRFSASGQLLSPAIATVFHNGVLVHNARAFWGATAHRRIGPYLPSTARGPIRLQDHQNPVRYRNIWVREVRDQE
jgi:Domain of Unknown Function (DUF1080)